MECDHTRCFITILFEQDLKHYSLITNTSRPCKCETAERTQVREINQANPRKLNPPKYRGINTQNLTVPDRRKGIKEEETENVLHMRGAKPTKKGSNNQQIKLRLISININGIRGKKNEIAAYLESMKPSIVAIQETKINNDVTSVEIIPN